MVSEDAGQSLIDRNAMGSVLDYDTKRILFIRVGICPQGNAPRTQESQKGSPEQSGRRPWRAAPSLYL